MSNSRLGALGRGYYFELNEPIVNARPSSRLSLAYVFVFALDCTLPGWEQRGEVHEYRRRHTDGHGVSAFLVWAGGGHTGVRTRPVRVIRPRHCRPHVVCAMTQCPRTLRILSDYTRNENGTRIATRGSPGVGSEVEVKMHTEALP